MKGQFLVEWRGGEKLPDGAISMPWPEYPEAVHNFFYEAGKEPWSDYGYDPISAGALVKNRGLIERASLEEVRTMLTWCVRGERFCDGHWAHILGDGTVFALLDRLNEILKEQGKGAAAPTDG